MKFFKRNKTREIVVGNIGIGGKNPVRVQTMSNIDCLDTKKIVDQIIRSFKKGAELMRISTPTLAHIRSFDLIRKKLKEKNINIPLIADIHYSPEIAFEALEFADKIRINPGNFLENKENGKKILKDLIRKAKKKDFPIRIGVNHGSLSQRIREKYGHGSKAMVNSLLEYLDFFEENNFYNLVLALKASNPLLMIDANKKLVAKLKKNKRNYPIHVGVTEAGSGESGKVKSIVGISNLLLNGIGDTIRVSLTIAPEKEIPICYDILQAIGSRITKVEFISCPTCSRTLFDMEKVTKDIKREIKHLPLLGKKIAIMGCMVNGLGEMKDADFAYIGVGRKKVNLYYKKKLIKSNISEDQALKELVLLVKNVL